MTRNVKGDVLELFQDGYFDIIAHGANCKGIMSAGIAAQIADLFPHVAEADNFLANSHTPPIPGAILPVLTEYGILVNMYTQPIPGDAAEYLFVQQCALALRRWILSSMKTTSPVFIGMPHIGCGIGGLEWDKVEKILKDTFEGPALLLYLVEYKSSF